MRLVLWRQSLEFRMPMIANVDKVVKITKAYAVLHNFMMKTNNANSNGYCPGN